MTTGETPIFIPLEPAARVSTCGSPPRTRDEFAVAPRFQDDVGIMAIMLTRRCNMSCAHCSVESGPKVQGEPDPAELSRIIADAAQAGVRAIQLTGGEPMLRQDVVLQLLRQCRAAGIHARMTSNGFWGSTPQRAQATLRDLCAAGLHHLTISYDRYHAAFMGPEPVVNIAEAAEAQGLLFFINITRTAEDGDLAAIVAPFHHLAHAQLRFYDIQPLGRARDLDVQDLRSEVDGFCNACTLPTVTDDGRMTACNGPAYFSPLHSPLQVGSLRDESMNELLARHRDDPILETIRTFGPSHLRAELSKLPGYEKFARPDYHGMCDLCLHLTSDAGAVAALQRHLGHPRFVAARAAARSLISGERKGGTLHRTYVNTVGAGRLFFQAARDAGCLDNEGASSILGRADLDWNAQAQYLGQCGLAPILAPAMDSDAVKRWAPQFFRDAIKKRALLGSMTALVQRQALREIAAALREAGAQGVLLKGAAMLAVSTEVGRRSVPARCGGDIDIYIAPSKASTVRALLLGRGFSETVDQTNVVGDRIETRHQLDKLVFQGVSIEIHQTLLARICGLPETEMLSDVRPLPGDEMASLFVLAPEPMLLHSAVHGAKHLFVHGLKTAWDFIWILDDDAAFDWHKLQRLAEKTGMQRGFWAVTTTLNRELELEFPPEFMAHAPRDRRQQKLNSVALRYFAGKIRVDFHDNAWACRGLLMLLNDSTVERARFLWDLVFGRHQRSLRRQRVMADSGYYRVQLHQLQRVWGAWRRFS